MIDEQREALTRFLAETVMGYKVDGYDIAGAHCCNGLLWSPTRDLNHAFELLGKEYYIKMEYGDSTACCTVPHGSAYSHEFADTPALAICLAVAKAHGWRDGE